MRVAAVWVVLLALAVLGWGSAANAQSPTPTLPPDLVIPDDTGEPLAGVVLRPGGDPLIVSNSPESITQVSGALALYRVRLHRSRFRVFLHHLNATPARLQIGWCLTNTSRKRVEVYVNRNSRGLPGPAASHACPSPADAGRAALLSWFQSGVPIARDRWLRTLGPRESCFAMESVGRGITTTGMDDLALRFADGDAAAPQVSLTVLACTAVPAAPMAVPLAPTVPPTRRGLFPSGVRRGRVECPLTGVRWLDLAGPTTGKFARPMGREFEPALDDGTTVNDGNYGVVYDLEIALANPTAQRLRVACLLNAAGGGGSSVLLVDGAVQQGPRTLAAFQSWVFGEVELPPGETRAIRVQFSLTGGSPGAQRLYFWPAAAQ